jgi:hypothetical protein
MKKIHLLLGSSDRRISNLIEITVRDACYGQGVVDFYRSLKLDDFKLRGCVEEHDLIIVTPQHLLPGLVRRNPQNMIEEAVRAIESIKEHRPVPVIAVGVSEEDELRFLMAGADNVFPIFFNADALKVEVARVLGLTEQLAVEETSPANRGASSWSGFFARGFERLIQRPKTEDMES